MKNTLCILALTILFLLLVPYVGSYCWLSAHGRYEPLGIGLSGVKYYGWAPRGFVTDYRWDETRMRCYYPLFYVDLHCWHPIDEAESGRYPINEVKSEDIGAVYRAWDN